MILINFKVYQQSFGEGAIKLAKICKEVMEETGIKVIPVVSALDAVRVMDKVGIDVYLQCIDVTDSGAKTGRISAIQAKELGIKGSLLNHSEHKLPPGTIKNLLTSWPEGFVSIVCLGSIGQASGWAKSIKPTMIAYEPGYLIGNKEKSVATEKPDVIKKMIDNYPDLPVLVGAGVKSEEDIKVSLKLGAKGFLIASAIVTAQDPKAELLKLVGAYSV
jgi:triosephosphate isomerase